MSLIWCYVAACTPLEESNRTNEQMFRAALIVVAAPVVLLVYAYLIYPAVLWVVAHSRRRAAEPTEDPSNWPDITITVPVHNGAGVIAATLDQLLRLDYPHERIQILVISDASTDDTDTIVRGYADRGVELLRLPVRSGKTAAENLAVKHARSAIIVNVDASVRVPSASLKPLMRAFADPTVGVVSGRDVSVAQASVEGNKAESNYVGYEMWVRSLETRVGSIVGASGCFFGFRRVVHEVALPPELSWDFASPLVARELGYRSVSAADAVCVVPRTPTVRTELRRKVRTMARGISTLLFKWRLMNPLQYGSFALMLISHKLVRWLPYLFAPLSLIALAWLAVYDSPSRALLFVSLVGITAGIIAMRWPRAKPIPRLVAFCGFALAAVSAGFLAWATAIQGKSQSTWEPTPRGAAKAT